MYSQMKIRSSTGWLISGPSKAVLESQKAYRTGKSKAYFSTQTKWMTKIYASFGFLNESFTVNEIGEFKKFPFQQL